MIIKLKNKKEEALHGPFHITSKGLLAVFKTNIKIRLSFFIVNIKVMHKIYSRINQIRISIKV